MKYYSIGGEAPGGLGPTAVYHRDSHGLIVVDYLDLEFEVWLGGEFVEDSDCYAVTEELWNALKSLDLKGVSTRAMTVTPGPDVNRNFPGRVFPRFLELVVPRSATGKYNHGLESTMILSEDVYLEQQEESTTQVILGKIHRDSIPDADMFSGPGLPLIATSRVRDFLKNYGGVLFLRSYRIDVVE